MKKSDILKEVIDKNNNIISGEENPGSLATIGKLKKTTDQAAIAAYPSDTDWSRIGLIGMPYTVTEDNVISKTLVKKKDLLNKQVDIFSVKKVNKDLLTKKNNKKLYKGKLSLLNSK